MKYERLYRLFQPTHYILDLILDKQKRTFRGTVTVTGVATPDSDSVYLHAHKLHIISARINEQPATFEHGDLDSLRLTTDHFQPGEQQVQIEFEGTITDPMHGIYPSVFEIDGRKDELLMTQFESHHARSAFPCVDEPEAKATFELTLRTETNVTTISNTPVKNQATQDGQLVTAFEKTPIMSTYLLAWVVGRLDYEEAKTKDGVTIRAYATPGKKAQLGYAVSEAVRCLEYFNDYFATPYPLDKCDLVAVPDFSAGAMENWGCITFRETALLIDGHSSTRAKQYVTMVIAHELAHQWFGNLVTMRWWNDLWLNESFANLMEHVASGELHPDWDMMVQHFEDETTHAMQRDALPSVQKIQQEIHTPDEIETLFDPAIVYAKGGSLLHMLHTYLGAEAFRDGLRIYLARHRYKNTDATDLWAALSEVSGKDIADFMEPWISQSGFPVMKAGIDNHTTVQLNQSRFYSAPRADHDTHSIWPIPLLSNNQLDTDMMTTAHTTAQLQSTAPLLLNQGRTGYYISHYDRQHVTKLAAEVTRGTLSVIDRLGLLSDSLSLSRAGLQSHRDALTLLEAYKQEQSQPVWGAISAHVKTLKMFADSDEEHITALRAFVRSLAIDQYERLGWAPQPDEPYFDALLRPHIIGHMAYSEDAAVIAKLRALFDMADKPSDIDADIRTIVLATAAKFGGEDAWHKLLRWHEHVESAEQRIQLITGLCATREPKLIQHALSLLTTDAVRLQDLFFWVIHLSRNRFALDVLWQWLQDHWQWITDKYGNDFHYTSAPKFIATAFSRPEQLASYRAFFEPKMNQTVLKRIIAQGIEDIEGRVQWRKRDSLDVAQYLRDRI